MIGCGTTTYTDPDAFRVSVPDVSANLVVTGPGPVRSRLTWVNMRHTRLLLVEAIRPRIAFVSLGSAPLFVSFAVDNTASNIFNGVHMRSGMLVFKEQTLAEAADQFNRYNTRQILVEGNARKIRIGGSFKADNVDVFVLLLHRGFGLSVNDRGDRIVVSR